MTGLFAWGSTFTSSADEYDGNEEHAIEVRSYPDPRALGPFYRGASASIDGAVIRNTVVWPQTATLGGGILAQGARVDVTNGLIYFNAGIGVSYQNGAVGQVYGTTISDNRGAALCLFSAGSVAIEANRIWGNATDKVGAC
jgi:hypothetical protein